MGKTGTKGFTTIVLLLVIVGLAYYVHLSNRNRNQKEERAKTEVEQLLQYDFENDYPKTVRETVKLHCRYMKCAYNKGFSDEELIVANQNIRKLFDEELLKFNTEQSQLTGLKDEIALYDENKQKFVSYSLSESSQIQYNEEGGQEYAKMKVGIVIKAGSSTLSGDEEYILRKDSQGYWKILGWQAIKKDTTEGESN
ncbi:MAG: hypothetical protein K2I10_11050 [Lachnospiraceae bacterium]|nr:hypothetical protein [Lachnospiraceae bacterium]